MSPCFIPRSSSTLNMPVRGESFATLVNFLRRRASLLPSSVRLTVYLHRAHVTNFVQPEQNDGCAISPMRTRNTLVDRDITLTKRFLGILYPFIGCVFAFDGAIVRECGTDKLNVRLSCVPSDAQRRFSNVYAFSNADGCDPWNAHHVVFM